jgi:anti-sigma B factor antagonist
MELSELGDKLVSVRLTGRLDTPGVDRIELRLTASLVPRGNSAVVDLSNVQFVTSMGIRMFISVAKALNGKQARLVLHSPQEVVSEIFDNAALGAILPIFATEAEALAAVGT